ncbi:PREDICTED: UPF0160 protein MYG1, mitochondrial-like [Priapulus caudatus]|uniref:UPF0160 protein MYG1, mitochondrial-like n=1 Tax=Priapulus caudatus TaxID=37621 RepID=A0ABM1E3X6_PRICU|nr:PREDICTED: UPF0160 protein MYG1, mitochondrial-like [Priapulus caudatus]
MSTPNVYKKQCLTMMIGTHNGTFHCDEVVACCLLRQLEEYRSAEIVRTRDQNLLEKCDIIVDVGGTFDASKKRFDHHQRSFSHTRNSLCPEKKWVTKLSSAGLIYHYFGARVIASLIGAHEDDDITGIIHDKIYENFIEEIDAIDNGINQSDGIKRYAIRSTLSSRVGYLNPMWNETNRDEQAGFDKAMELVREELLDRVLYYKDVWWPARELVEEALRNRMEVDSSGEIVCFARGGVPWKEHLFALEAKLGVDTGVKYVLYKDDSGRWRNQCVPLNNYTFENRLSLPEAWRGVRDEELSRVSGIPGCMFVHATGFCGGNSTYEGALAMVRKSLQMQSDKVAETSMQK